MDGPGYTGHVTFLTDSHIQGTNELIAAATDITWNKGFLVHVDEK